MKKIERFSASLEPEILSHLDAYRRKRGLPTRSDALRALVRAEVLSEGWRGANACYAVITLLYDHHGSKTARELTEIQHDSRVKVLVTQHIHLSHSICLEVITAKGLPADLEKLANLLGAVNGVKRCSISRAAIEREL